MDQKERRKLLGVLLINSGVFYIQRIKKRNKNAHTEILLDERIIKRDSLSAYNTTFKELHLNDREYFRRYLRMNTKVYDLK